MASIFVHAYVSLIAGYITELPLIALRWTWMGGLRWGSLLKPLLTTALPTPSPLPSLSLYSDEGLFSPRLLSFFYHSGIEGKVKNYSTVKRTLLNPTRHRPGWSSSSSVVRVRGARLSNSISHHCLSRIREGMVTNQGPLVLLTLVDVMWLKEWCMNKSEVRGYCAGVACCFKGSAT